MKYVLYTTTSSDWYRKEAEKASVYLNLTKGRENVQFDIVKVSPPKYPQLIVDEDGDIRFSWDWFRTQFPVGEYDGVGFHFTPYYKRKWGLSKRVNGTKHTQNKDYPEFWICCEKEPAEGYDFISNFVRLLVHEISHFDEDLDDKTGNHLTQESVHRWDYEFKSIHYYPRLIDYRGYMLKRRVNQVVNQVIDFVRNALRP